MFWHKIWITDTGEGEAVKEEKAENREDAYQYAVPQFTIHASLDGLFTLVEILHREVERIQSPHIECR
jgi:hypothetical protein